MKKLLRLLFIFTLLLSLFGCTQPTSPTEASTAGQTESLTATAAPPSYTVPSPMSTPDYTFSGTPTTDQLRQTAIQGMKDLLSIQWCTEIEIAYRKTGPMNQKSFLHRPENTYAGTLYSNASTGLFQFMEYYDQETGILSYPGTVDKLKESIGNSCADSLLWGYSTVCNSIQGGYFPLTMVYANGYLPVGNYYYDRSIDTFLKYPTDKIFRTNGQDKMVHCYTLVQPADALLSSVTNHAIMAIGKPHIEYNADGTINLDHSYIPIQDQRAGDGAGFYKVTEGGCLIQYSGRTSYNFTFSELVEKYFVPVTTAEFIGEKPYEKATVSTDKKNITTISQLLDTTVSSNYPLALVRLKMVDKEANTELVLERKLFNGKQETGVPRSYKLSELHNLSLFKNPGDHQKGKLIRIEVVVSTGEEFTVAEITL